MIAVTTDILEPREIGMCQEDDVISVMLYL